MHFKGKDAKALRQAAFTGEKRGKQITTLIEAVKGGITVKFPDEVGVYI